MTKTYPTHCSLVSLCVNFLPYLTCTHLMCDRARPGYKPTHLTCLLDGKRGSHSLSAEGRKDEAKRAVGSPRLLEYIYNEKNSCFWYLYVKDIYVTALGLVTWFIAKLNRHIFHVEAKRLVSWLPQFLKNLKRKNSIWIYQHCP